MEVKEDFLVLKIDDLIELSRDVEFRHSLNGRFIAYTLRTQIREMRLRKGWTQSELAERCGTVQPIVARWENIKNPHFPTIDTLRTIAKVFDVCLVVRFEEWGSLFRKIVEVRESGMEIPREFKEIFGDAAQKSE